MGRLTQQQINFVETFVEINDATKAYKLSGYAGDRSNAHKLVQKLSSHINERLQSRMSLKTATALSILEELMVNPHNAPRDRLNAVNSFLDRSSVARASTQKVDVTQNEIVDQSRKVIRNGEPIIMVGNGLELPVLDGASDATAYDINDEETYRYLKSKSH